MNLRSPGRDARILLGITGFALAIIAVGAFFAPARIDNNPTPSIDNSGSAGAKAAYTLLGQLGYHVQRFDEPAAALDRLPADHTTLILAGAGLYDYRTDKDHLTAFLNRGGHILAAGMTSGAMLPGSSQRPASRLYTALCETVPQGLSPQARAGRLQLPIEMSWDTIDAVAIVDQACGTDPVVVHYPMQSGEAIWWTSPYPLTNRGLQNDANLRLLLAAVGAPGGTVLFDEYIHGAREDLWDTAAGTPVVPMGWQLAAVGLLLVFSYGRRNGPLRTPIRVQRTSPLEFVHSMGDLYRKAGAVTVAASAAERRLLHFLEAQGGIPRATLQASPGTIAAAVAERFRTAPASLAEDITALRNAEQSNLSPKSALALIRRIDHHIAALSAAITAGQPSAASSADRR
ncbi:DUF4350 domain-containing protein [Silvibacterium dinghuense]|uniref:DUF4350 domain-containing protein n=1 Tax=Silvibacterium dinghuense TaxID=1560006 RepID=A0A4Q1SGY7_9BACT|nr:DUF4350 domain-containing protein [Silvibacterium dinghuense]RXS96629.1 DUF4350 domain-containing protein [Silvibacterium dinghuense]GGG92367.1 hypothetical protein GCM10011586_03810 [Silvibacterium dinghuense]